MIKFPFLHAKQAGATRDEALDLLAQIAERLERLLKTAEATNRLLRDQGHASTETDKSGNHTPRRGRQHADTPRRASMKRAKLTRSRRDPGLHQEIAAVLSELGQPMSPGEVAEQIRARGRFVGRPGSGPVTATHVSSRVSNPHYRDQFVRRDGRISLAKP